MFGVGARSDSSAIEICTFGKEREMTRRNQRAELLNRLCELRDLYRLRGPDDREASVSFESLLDHLWIVWDQTQVASEPNA
jgi:hypothetical protein